MHSMTVFRRLLLNTLVSGVTSSFLWFALTFWVYLETRSVVATGVIGGAFSILSALLGLFAVRTPLVDCDAHHRHGRLAGAHPGDRGRRADVLQRSIPFERQGRVFGFAQPVENAASPLTAFLMAPLAETIFMPLMTNGRGADWIGGWFGTGPERGLALMFTLAGMIGVAVTAMALASRSYRQLAAASEPDVAVVE